MNVTAGGILKQIKSTNVEKKYKILVADLPGIEKGFKNVGGAKYSFVKFNLLFNNKAGERIRHYTYLQYLVVDETTKAVNVEETRAETNVTKTEIIHDGDDCLKDKGGKIKDCVEEIDLETKLTCYSDENYLDSSKLTMSSEIIVGDLLYCQMEFVDPTIVRYLWINSVNVTTPVDKRLKDVYPTGYYYRADHNNKYTRFVILVYWPEKMSNIAVTAKVKRIPECDHDDCLACDGGRNCTDCRGALKAQDKECVVNCGDGYYEYKGACKNC